MAELREHLTSLGFSNLVTYIQSGNIVFQSIVKENAELEDLIHQNIKTKYGFDVPVIVRTQKEWQSVVNKFPFNTTDYDLKRIGVVYLKDKPTQIPLVDIENYKAANDELVYENKEIYLYMPEGFGNSKLTNNVFERKLKVSGTTRNWRTTLKLLELCKNLE